MKIYWKIIAKIGQLVARHALPASLKDKKSVLDTDTILKLDKWIREKRWAEDLTMQEIAIEEAKKLLLEDRDIPTLIIGEAVGICDKSNFRRQFKEITGCTPAEWRLKH